MLPVPHFRLPCVQAYSGVIEYQKCGLPHAHFLVTLKPADKPRDVENFDRFVSAEIPDPAKFPQAHATIARTVVRRLSDGRSETQRAAPRAGSGARRCMAHFLAQAGPPLPGERVARPR